MSKSIKTIQEKIEAKARERAENEVHEAIKAMTVLRDSKVFDEQRITIEGVGVDGKNHTTLREAFWWWDRTIPQRVVDELTEKYIPQEIDNFVNKVEALEKEVEALSGYTNHIQHSEDF